MKLKSLVIIDDDPCYRQLCADAFGADFTVRCAAGGAEGLSACRQGVPDVVLLDLRMPRVDGVQVLRALAEDPTTSAVPVVVFSASYMDPVTHTLLDGLPNVRGRLDKLARLQRVREALCAAANGN